VLPLDDLNLDLLAVLMKDKVVITSKEILNNNFVGSSSFLRASVTDFVLELGK